MLAAVFRFFPPSILLARMFSAFWVFTACLLFGLLATRITGRRTIGVIVPGAKAPAGKIVISSEEVCQHCEIIARSGVYSIYKAL